MLKGDEDQIFESLSYLPHYSNDKHFSSSYVCVDSQDVRQFTMLDCNDQLIDSKLNDAVREILNEQFVSYTNTDHQIHSEDSELDESLVKFAIDNTTSNKGGRQGSMVMPILWNSHSCHLLGQNKHLSEVILNSPREKLDKDPHRLSLVNQVFEDQIKEGIIERIPDLETYMKENPQCSFLPFMGVFREQRETTKCCVVFLSNLSENNPN